MKTLSEEINEIKNAKMSKTAKRTALAKLGLIASDVEIIMSNMPAPESRGSRFGYTFGKWFEMDGCLYSNTIWLYRVNNRRFVYSPTA